MSVFLLYPPASSFRLGLPAITSNLGKSTIASAARSFSTRHPSIAPRFRCSSLAATSFSKLRTNRQPSNLLPLVPVRRLSRFRAITHYTEIPDSYEDANGLPFRKEDLNQREVNEIFGPHLPAPQANKLLSILHGRRVAGTLEDPNLQVNTARFSDEDKRKALQYLRTNIPVDEVINAGLRAEDELRYLEEQEQDGAKAEEPSGEPGSHDQPADAGVKEIQFPDGRLPRASKSDSPYGIGAFDRIRAQNIAKREAEEKRLAEEQRKREEEEALGNVGTLQTELQKPKQLSPFVQKWTERAMSDLTEPPKMKAWERLLPSIAMAILICAGCAAFAAMYTPPRRSGRLWPDIPPAAATLLAIIGINLTVWVAWYLPPVWGLLNRYFIMIPATPRPFQLLGATFSHQTFSHCAMNMIPLWFFGTRLHDEIGRGNFLAIYLASGALGFLTSLTKLVLLGGLSTTSLGASGSVYGVAVAYFWLHKYDEFKLFGYPPDPLSGPQGLAFIGLMIGLHIVPLFSKKVHSIDIPSHLGGIVAGVAGGELVKRHMDEKARIRAERLKTIGALEKAAQ